MSKKLALILLSILISSNSFCFAKEKVKLGASYSIKKRNKLELRITQVPKKYPWIEKDLDGKTVNPEYDSIVVAENVKALKITDEFGDAYTIPKGSKFFAKVKNIIPAKSFWRKEKVELDFYALAIGDGSFDEYFEETSFQNYDGKHSLQPKESRNKINFDQNINFNSKNNESSKDILKNIGALGGYTLAGAIAGPFMLFSISSVVGAATTISAFSNPYVVGGAAAVGGAVGFISGVVKKGRDLKIEPGQKVNISLDDSWRLTKVLNEDLKNKSPLKAEKINDKFILDILKVKKAKDSFGDIALQITFSYKNKTDQEITYTSFKLVDSTGKAYEANVDDLSLEFYDGLPKQGSLRLSFTVDYPNAPHQLKVLDRLSRKALTYKDVILN